MAIELTLDQVRVIAALRRRHPQAEITPYERLWGVIIEVREHNRTRQVLAFDAAGSVRRDERVLPRAA